MGAGRFEFTDVGLVYQAQGTGGVGGSFTRTPGGVVIPMQAIQTAYVATPPIPANNPADLGVITPMLGSRGLRLGLHLVSDAATNITQWKVKLWGGMPSGEAQSLSPIRLAPAETGTPAVENLYTAPAAGQSSDVTLFVVSQEHYGFASVYPEIIAVAGGATKAGDLVKAFLVV